MKRVAMIFAAAALLIFGLVSQGASVARKNALAANTSASNTPAKEAAEKGADTVTQKSYADEAEALETRRQQLAEKEAALKVKEQELNNLAASLDVKINELNAAKKTIDKAVTAKKKESDERYTRVLRVYRALKPDEAGKLINKLDDEVVIEMLDRMDQKTVVKLIPFLNQPNVLKWTRENLKHR